MGAITSFLGDLKVLLLAATTKPPSPDQIASFSLLVEDNAARIPDAIALICEEEVVTWKELNERSNRIATH